jgi:hypothetical protein
MGQEACLSVCLALARGEGRLSLFLSLSPARGVGASRVLTLSRCAPLQQSRHV